MQVLKCPVAGCEKVAQGIQGISAHVRAAHPAHYRLYGAREAAPVEVVTPAEVLSPAYAVEVVAVSPLEHLDSALVSLWHRLNEIDGELVRLEELKTEQASIQSRIAALQKARVTFEERKTTDEAVHDDISAKA